METARCIFPLCHSLAVIATVASSLLGSTRLFGSLLLLSFSLGDVCFHLSLCSLLTSHFWNCLLHSLPICQRHLFRFQLLTPFRTLCNISIFILSHLRLLLLKLSNALCCPIYFSLHKSICLILIEVRVIIYIRNSSLHRCTLIHRLPFRIYRNSRCIDSALLHIRFIFTIFAFRNLVLQSSRAILLAFGFRFNVTTAGGSGIFLFICCQ